KDVYIKPVAGLQGRGIIRIISLDQGGFVFRYRDGEKNFEKKFRNQRSAMKFLKKRTSSGNYLVQQSVKLLQYRGGPVDFRCVMQKNQTGMWKCRTIIGRCGRPGSVVSNISSGGSALRGEEAIRRIRPEWDSGAVISRMEKLALSVCNALDGLGLNFGTLGLDIGVDDEGIFWLIEINNRDPDTTIALNIKDKKLFCRLKEGPLFYAKALAGFSSTDEEES
ncbi:MAG TPA: YheC/YheD family protein, partial [Clostridia bacterium]|nr:YheC/YheD family protein [Clostridia bacterium]